ncbi:uncharacterized protein LOC141905260 [Tubulanus polymorphus]|uniref:uncharacterized protein LOC141905260 n=1 Tax=Tubulanus polymorphus TaxID=672921 RepID=UPI003DA63ED0
MSWIVLLLVTISVIAEKIYTENFDVSSRDIVAKLHWASCDVYCLERFGRSRIENFKGKPCTRNWDCAVSICSKCRYWCKWPLSDRPTCIANCTKLNLPYEQLSPCYNQCNRIYRYSSTGHLGGLDAETPHSNTSVSIVCGGGKSRKGKYRYLWLRHGPVEQAVTNQRPAVYLLTVTNARHNRNTSTHIITSHSPLTKIAVTDRSLSTIIEVYVVTAATRAKLGEIVTSNADVKKCTKDSLSVEMCSKMPEVTSTPHTTSVPTVSTINTKRKVTIENFTVDQHLGKQGISVNLSWSPVSDFGSGGIQYDVECLTRPCLPNRKVVTKPSASFKGLNYDKTYTIRIRIKPRDVDHYLNEFRDSFKSADCLNISNFNFNLCPPGKVESLSYTLHPRTNGDEFENGTATTKFYDVEVVWTAPRNINTSRNLLTYSLEWYEIGTPKPSMSDQKQTRPGNETTLRISKIAQGTRFRFIIIPKTRAGSGPPKPITIFVKEKEIIETKTSQISNDPYAYVIEGSLFLCVTALVGILAFTSYKCYKKRKRPAYSHALKRKVECMKTNQLYAGEFGVNESYTDSFVDVYEINYSCLKPVAVIGEGAFGKVMKAEVVTPDAAKLMLGKTVAVKTLKEFASDEEKVSLLSEIALMKELGRHANVVSILACCTRGQKLALIMDYCQYGDLQSYLRKIHDSMGNRVFPFYRTGLIKMQYTPVTTDTSQSSQSQSIDDLRLIEVVENRINDNLNSENDTNENDTNIYQNDTQNNSNEKDIILDDYVETNSHMSTRVMMSFARQISIGMEYLSRKFVVHRDLAARNILVYDRNIVKISDFGLSRDVYERSYYHKNTSGKLPLKWMSPEAIFEQKYTTRSDVWSFGVLVWEILTLGGSPFPGVNNDELIPLLRDNYRMEKPINCTDDIYQLLLMCWHPLPTCRPTFTDLRQKIDAILERIQPYVDLSSADNDPSQSNEEHYCLQL